MTVTERVEVFWSRDGVSVLGQSWAAPFALGISASGQRFAVLDAKGKLIAGSSTEAGARAVLAALGWACHGGITSIIQERGE